MTVAALKKAVKISFDVDFDTGIDYGLELSFQTVCNRRPKRGYESILGEKKTSF